MVYCNKCGSENQDGSMYCWNCGSPIQTSEQRSHDSQRENQDTYNQANAYVEFNGHTVRVADPDKNYRLRYFVLLGVGAVLWLYMMFGYSIDFVSNLGVMGEIHQSFTLYDIVSNGYETDVSSGTMTAVFYGSILLFLVGLAFPFLAMFAPILTAGAVFLSENLYAIVNHIPFSLEAASGFEIGILVCVISAAVFLFADDSFGKHAQLCLGQRSSVSEKVKAMWNGRP